MAAVSRYVEGLRLYTGRVDDRPFEVILGELGIWDLFGLSLDRLDRLGAINGFLSAGNVGQPGSGQSTRHAERAMLHEILTVAWPS